MKPCFPVIAKQSETVIQVKSNFTNDLDRMRIKLRNEFGFRLEKVTTNA